MIDHTDEALDGALAGEAAGTPPAVDQKRLTAELDRLGAAYDELQRRRDAEASAVHGELLRNEQEVRNLHREAQQARKDAEHAQAEVSAIEATKIFRYSAGLRQLYGQLRRRADSPEPQPEPSEAPTPEPEPLTFTEWAARYDTLDEADRDQVRRRVAAIADPPLITVILPVFNTPEGYLRQAIDSVRHQLYPRWELCIVDDSSTDTRTVEVVDEHARLDDRIKVLHRPDNGHISAASNSGLAMASGSWVALLDHDDTLAEHALALVAVEIDNHPDAGLVFSDEDVIDHDGRRIHSYFKPDFDPLLLLGQNHINHLTVIRRDVVEGVGGFREGFEGSQDWDLLLRVTERLARPQVRHVPHILYHWRSHPGSTASSLAAKPYAAGAGWRAVSEHIERQQLDAAVTPIPALGWNRITWGIPDPAPLVTIIIPTRDGRYLHRCLQSIWALTTYPSYEIIVVDNGSTSHATLQLLRDNAGRLQVMRDERPFSYSGLNNAAAERATGQILCLMNDDTEVITPGWLDEMVGQLLRPDVGAVGAKLYYDDGTVQHAGVVLGIGGVGGHVHRRLDRLDIGYWGRAALAHHFSAVTAACMAVRREAWEQLGGLNDHELSIGYNDVDFCLRLGQAGWRVVWTPFAELLHHESISRGPDLEGPNADRLAREGAYMQRTWGMLLRNDPAYNPNLSLAVEDFAPAYPPRATYDELGSER